MAARFAVSMPLQLIASRLLDNLTPWSAIRAIPYQDPKMEAERLKAVHEARVKIVPRV